MIHRRNMPLRRQIMLSWQQQNHNRLDDLPPEELKTLFRKAIRRVPRKYAKFARALFRQYYFVKGTDQEIDLRVCRELGISERTYRNWRKELTEYMETKNLRSRFNAN